MQSALSPHLDWRGDVITGPSQQTWLEKNTFLLGAACPIDQREERKNVIFENPYDGTDGTKGEIFSKEYHQG
jgi:hypothetical protein